MSAVLVGHCATGKSGYLTAAQAREYLKQARRRSNMEAGKSYGKVVPYKCDGCGMWHIGHSYNGRSLPR